MNRLPLSTAALTALRDRVEDVKSSEIAMNLHLGHKKNYYAGSTAVSIRWDLLQALLDEVEASRAKETP